MHREPRRALPAVLRHDEDRVAGDRHDIAAADVDNADVHAVLWRNEHRGIAASEPRVDDLLENFGGDLADLRQVVDGLALAHRFPSAGITLTGYGVGPPRALSACSSSPKHTRVQFFVKNSRMAAATVSICSPVSPGKIGSESTCSWTRSVTGKSPVE